MSAAYMRRCANKRRFELKGDAQAARAALTGDTGAPSTVYACNQCLGWHIGGAGNRFRTRYRRSGKRANKRMRGRL